MNLALRFQTCYYNQMQVVQKLQMRLACFSISSLFAALLPCPAGYVLNPITQTCLRHVGAGRNWTESKASCEAQGETLAVFTTQASLAWIRDYVKQRAPSGK